MKAIAGADYRRHMDAATGVADRPLSDHASSSSAVGNGGVTAPSAIEQHVEAAGGPSQLVHGGHAAVQSYGARLGDARVRAV
jgi:hypothetical protein